MSFYLTLPSNASFDVFPNNSLSDFTTLLKIPLSFNSPYEVALVEISLNRGWTADLGTSLLELVYSNDSSYKVLTKPFEIKHDDGQSLSNLISKINESLFTAAFELEKEYKNKQLTDEEIKEFVLSAPLMTLRNNEIKIQTNNKYQIHFSQQLAYLFNLNQEINVKDENVNVSFLNSDHILIHNSLFVYTDIIKYQYVGDTLVPLLRNISIPLNFRYNNYIVYETPHYLPVKNSYIDTINITIKDEMGQTIKFYPGKLLIKLHFRPAGYGF